MGNKSTLLKICKDYNIGLKTLVDFLNEKGAGIENVNPNVRISNEYLPDIAKEFGGDLNAKREAESVGIKMQEIMDSRRPREEEKVISKFREWCKSQKECSYCVFDLEIDTNDDTKIKQLAYVSAGELQSCDSPTEDNIKELLKVLEKADVVVGHNIQNWDLKKLSEKGLKLKQNALIWDTLEMEMYLSPQTGIYSLQTKHSAKYDTELTEKLFLSQLYRFSKNENLSDRLVKRREFCERIKNIIDTLKLFTNYSFLHRRIEISEEIKKEIKRIAHEKGKVLIIAAKSMWQNISRSLNVRFPYTDDEFQDYIDNKKVKNNNGSLSSQDENAFDKSLFLDVFSTCPNFTPLKMNLPRCLAHRKDNEGFTKDEDNEDFFKSCCSEFRNDIESPVIDCIDCTDISGLTDENFDIKKYEQVYVVDESLLRLSNRSRPLLSPLTSIEMEKKHRNLFFRMGQLNYFSLNKNEELIKELISEQKIPGNSNIRNYVSSYWCERGTDNHYKLYYSIDFDTYLKDLKESKVKVERVGSIYAGVIIGKAASDLVELVKCKPERIIDSGFPDKKYWFWQFGLLKAYMENEPEPLKGPVIYIIDNEIPEVKKYAQGYAEIVFGFEFPERKISLSLFRKIELLKEGEVMVLNKTDFRECAYYCVNKPLIYVWDHLDIEKHFEVDIMSPKVEVVLKSLLDELKLYASIIGSSNEKSCLLVLDPYLDNIGDEEFPTEYSFKTVSPKAEEIEKKIGENLGGQSDPLENRLKNLQLPEEAGNIDVQKKVISDVFIGEGNEFSKIQDKVITHILNRGGDCIVSIPTGGGKSVLFQGPALYRNCYSRRLSLVVTPLRALMQDQVTELRGKGFGNRVAYLNSDIPFVERNAIYTRMVSGELALLYVTPERFRTRPFIERLRKRMERDGGLEYVIFDEAHCITQWGLDFRPDYRYAVGKCVGLRNEFAREPPSQEASEVFMVAMFSATVSAMVKRDLEECISNPDIKFFEALDPNNQPITPIRDHIQIRFADAGENRLEKIVDYIKEKKPDFNQSRMIVFCPERRLCEEESVKFEGIIAEEEEFKDCKGKIGYFHAGLESEERTRIYEDFKNKNGKICILFSTSAFGLGMDIPNIHYLVHYKAPQNLEDYLQEVGRAGRDVNSYEKAFQGKPDHYIDALCLTSPEDFEDLKGKIIKGQLSWTDLDNAREEIKKYLENFSDLQKKEFITTPYSIWVKDKNRPEKEKQGLSKLAFYWLEKMECITTDYLEPSYLKIELVNSSDSSSNFSNLLEYIKKDSPDFNSGGNGENGGKIVSLSDVKKVFPKKKYSLPKLVNSLLDLKKKGRVEMNQEFDCRITDKRRAEVFWMAEKNKNEWTLHMAFETLKKLLSQHKEVSGKSKVEGSECQKYMEEQLRKLTKDDMPWKDCHFIPEDSFRHSITSADSFKKSLNGSINQKICNWTSNIPGITHSTILNEVFIKIEDKDKYKNKDKYKYKYEDYLELETLEKDCFKFLKGLTKQEGSIRWPQLLTEKNKRYDYFNTLLTILRDLQYIEHTPLIEYGVGLKANADKENADKMKGIDDSYKKEFETGISLKKLRLIAMKIFSKISEEDKRTTFIKEYFACKSDVALKDFLGNSTKDQDILNELKEVAITKEEELLNEEQKKIYDQTGDIMVLAGPGSGKTKVLTMKCARLVYRGGVTPQSILVLAFNRGVVVELKKRLNYLFKGLGLGPAGNKLNIYTFDALALKCKPELSDESIECWDAEFLKYLNEDGRPFRKRFNDISHILVDEFQDVNNYRLKILLKFHELYPGASFFVIGDKDQSIYGFDRVNEKDDDAPDYAKNMSSETYYELFKVKIGVKDENVMTMNTNYRSYQEILDASERYKLKSESNFKWNSESPHANNGRQLNGCVTIHKEEDDKDWLDRVKELLKMPGKEDKEDGIEKIAIMFRHNSEVLQAHQRLLKEKEKEKEYGGWKNVTIKIQGQNKVALYRRREFYWMIDWFEQEIRKDLEFDQDMSDQFDKEYEERYLKWDENLMSMGRSLVRYWLENEKKEDQKCGDLASYLRWFGNTRDDDFLYNVHAMYPDEEAAANCKRIIVTTMHKVKGLEFDAVIIGPSKGISPRLRNKTKEDLQVDDRARLDEEVRLQYVACTRARKRLDVYMGERGKQLDTYLDQRKKQVFDGNSIFLSKESEQSERWKPTGVDSKLENYVLSFRVGKKKEYESHVQLIESNLLLGSKVKIEKNGCIYVTIGSEGKIIGNLSNLLLKKNINFEDREFIISDIAVWEYQDSANYDKNNKETNYAKSWCVEAQKKKYTYVPILTEVPPPPV